jgi:ABC-type phosphate transport system permease subunit
MTGKSKNNNPSCRKCKSENIQKSKFYFHEKKEFQKGSNLIIGCLVIIFLVILHSVILYTITGTYLISYYNWPTCLLLTTIP